MTVEQHRQPSDPVVTSAADDDDDDDDGVPAIFSDLIFFSFFLLFCYFCNRNYVVKEFSVKDVQIFDLLSIHLNYFYIALPLVF
jgi:hypothetical protein